VASDTVPILHTGRRAAWARKALFQACGRFTGEREAPPALSPLLDYLDYCGIALGVESYRQPFVTIVFSVTSAMGRGPTAVTWSSGGTC